MAHFPHETTYLTLQRPGKSKKWHPRFYIRNDRRVYMLRGQWLDFVRDNHVQEGDICLLLPEKTGRKFTLTVYLLRATETHSSAEMASLVHIKEESTDGITDEHNNTVAF